MAASKTRRGARRRRRPDSSAPPRAAGPLTQALIDIRVVLDELEMNYALVGGLAVSARAEPARLAMSTWPSRSRAMPMPSS